MPDTNGKLQLVEMREQVRRKLDLLRFQLDATGSEVTQQQIDQLVSNQDINMYLNMNLARRSIDMNIADNTIMADEAAIDIIANQVEYALPDDLMFLRGVYFKQLGITYTGTPPNVRVPIYELDADNSTGFQPSFDQIFSYRRRLNLIVLNQVPTNNNQGGLVVDYVKLTLPLLDDAQTLESPLFYILQQVIIQDAAVEINGQKLRLDGTELRQTQSELVAQLHLAAINYHAPKILTMTPSQVVAYAPFARRPNSWQRIFGFNNWW